MTDYRYLEKVWADFQSKGHDLETPGLSLVICEVKRVSRYGIGGQAFRDWWAGILYKGVYFACNNHNVYVLVSEDPKAIFTSGCTDSRCYGNAKPCSSTGAKLLHISVVPPEVQEKAKVILLEIYEHITERVNAIVAREKEAEKETQRLHLLKQQNIINNWKDLE
jgi:hypothetical protein